MKIFKQIPQSLRLQKNMDSSVLQVALFSFLESPDCYLFRTECGGHWLAHTCLHVHRVAHGLTVHPHTHADLWLWCYFQVTRGAKSSAKHLTCPFSCIPVNEPHLWALLLTLSQMSTKAQRGYMTSPLGTKQSLNSDLGLFNLKVYSQIESD